MCWKPPYKRLKTKTDETKNITQYVLETTIQKTQDEDRRNKKHSTICVGNHHTKDSRRRQTKQKTQHNMCWKPPYKRLKTKTETKNIAQYVLETTIQKTQDEDRRNKKHSTICVGNHHTKDSRRRQTKQKT